MQDEAAPPGPEQDGQVPRWLFWLGIILLVLLLVVLAVWTQRTPIADNLIRREVVKRNISARYDIAEIGLRTQRLENLTLGNQEREEERGVGKEGVCTGRSRGSVVEEK